MANSTSEVGDCATKTVAEVNAVGPPANPIESIIITASVRTEL